MLEYSTSLRVLTWRQRFSNEQFFFFRRPLWGLKVIT